MPLINCPVCKNPVSDLAMSCPKCGHPLRKTEYKFIEVASFGCNTSGAQQELDTLLAKGWQIIDCDDSDQWVDSEGYECCVRKYKLIKN